MMIWKILIYLFLVLSNHDSNLTKSYDLKGFELEFDRFNQGSGEWRVFAKKIQQPWVEWWVIVINSDSN